MLRAVVAALRRRHLDLRLRRRGFDVRIVERPGMWMQKADLAALAAQLRQVADRVLGEGGLRYGVFAGEAEPLCRAVITLVTEKDGTPIAFNALSILTVRTGGRADEVVHLGLVMVDPGARSRGFSWVLYGLTCFLLLVRQRFRPIWVSNVTQVPAVVGMVSETFSGVWPHPEGGRRSLRHLLLGREIMAAHRDAFGVGAEAEFDEARFVIENAYTGGSDDLRKTWEEAPKHRREAVNAFCETALDYGRGDDFLQLGQMDMVAMRSFLQNQVPRGAVLWVLVTAGLVALQRLVAPVVQWMDASRQWKTLRPAK